MGKIRRDIDCIILAHCRSGTHMLASALNGHPEVNALDEPGRGIGMFPDDWESDKPVWVQIHTYPVWDREFKGKVIRLTRPLEGLIEAHHRISKGKYGPFKETVSTPELSEKEKQDYIEYLSPKIDEMNEWCKDKEALFIDYEELTSNIDIDVIPTPEIICDFLGVETMELKPITVKAKVVNYANV